jgi:hypothetical protein
MLGACAVVVLDVFEICFIFSGKEHVLKAK